LLIGAVLVMNVQCALAFIVSPAAFAPGFELEGPVGEAMVRALGVLFLMWNVPYAVAAWHPQKHRLSLFEAVCMQAIGVAGETAIFLALPLEHAQVRLSIARFLIFDASGLVALLTAVFVSRAVWVSRAPRS